MSDIPQYIIEIGGNHTNWIPSQDDISNNAIGKKVNERNQIKFWLTNVKIREHIADLKIKAKEWKYSSDIAFPNITTQSFSEKSGVPRKTIYKREAWVKKELDAINRLASRKIITKNESTNSLVLDELNDKILLLRKNAGEDFIKIKRLESRISDLNRALEAKVAIIDALRKECEKLSKIVYGGDDNQRYLGGMMST